MTGYGLHAITDAAISRCPAEMNLQWLQLCGDRGNGADGGRGAEPDGPCVRHQADLGQAHIVVDDRNQSRRGGEGDKGGDIHPSDRRASANKVTCGVDSTPLKCSDFHACDGSSVEELRGVCKGQQALRGWSRNIQLSQSLAASLPVSHLHFDRH
ncbi:MAG: hypothetical protein FRX49_01529 [Trebouxia sp. A1-2]|nr:MAG: hypothetical protein FRX49_01529 [Trebouxia sp. A1-2]